MPSVVPHRFLFRYSFPVTHVRGIPKKGKSLLDLPAGCALPQLDEVDGGKSFAEIRVGWNAAGLGIAARVRGKKKPPVGDLDAATESDGMQVWIDTRNTQSIHRASRFCHHFCLLPRAAGAKFDQPAGVELPIARAREERVPSKPSQIKVAATLLKDGYDLEAWLSADVLTGYDPESNPRLGFYCVVRDHELGEQFLTVGSEFPFAHDPSLWSTLELLS